MESADHGAVAGPRRVLIVHSESNVGDSFALLLAMRGFEAVQIGDALGALAVSRKWRPQVLFVDTLIGERTIMRWRARCARR